MVISALSFVIRPSGIRHYSELAARSGKNPFDDFSMHIREAKMAALKLERRFCVVDPQAAQDRGVQVMHVDWIAIDVVGEIICFPVPAIQIVKQRG